MNAASRPDLTDEMTMQRLRMVDVLRDKYKITDERVLEVMGRLPRHLFVPEAIKSQAYRDNALPIAGGQTISQPFIVARMTELLELTGQEKVLEIGAGSGYQTAVLASLARKVFAIERLPAGWDTYKPFDAILVAAGGPGIPEPLVLQLRVGGRLVVPVGADRQKQNLIRVTRTENGSMNENFGPCAFVPLIGSYGWETGDLH